MKFSKLIKDLLIEMAIEGTLPSDMNEFDETTVDSLITKEAIRKAAEKYGLGQILSTIPEGMEYNDIIEALEDESYQEKGIVVWQPFEDYNGSYILEQIENATTAGENLINDFFFLNASE